MSDENRTEMPLGDRPAGGTEVRMDERQAPPDRPISAHNGVAPADKTLPRDLRQELTDRMVAALDQGAIPWERPWHEVRASRPRNLLSSRDYQGGNRLMLMLVQLERGYSDPRFGTIRQINQLGGRVNQGEKGYPIEYWSEQPFYERRDVEVSYFGDRVNVLKEDRHGIVIRGTDDWIRHPRTVGVENLKVRHDEHTLTWNEAHQTLDRLAAKVSTVFNVAQTHGLTLEPIESKTAAPLPTIERAESILAGMYRDGLQLQADNRGAYYVHARDTVYLPDRDRFATVEGYYGTALHEIGHATGAAKRLNREGITGGHRYGTPTYAREELRAELFSVFIAAETGIPHDEGQHRAYIQNWSQILRADKHEIFRAASEAGKAIDYVLQKEQELTRAPEQTIEHRPEAQPSLEPPSDVTSAEPPPASVAADPKADRRRSPSRRRALER